MVDSRNSETEKTEIVNGKAIRLADCSMRKRERKRETNRREEKVVYVILLLCVKHK